MARIPGRAAGQSAAAGQEAGGGRRWLRGQRQLSTGAGRGCCGSRCAPLAGERAAAPLGGAPRARTALVWRSPSAALRPRAVAFPGSSGEPRRGRQGSWTTEPAVNRAWHPLRACLAARPASQPCPPAPWLLAARTGPSPAQRRQPVRPSLCPPAGRAPAAGGHPGAALGGRTLRRCPPAGGAQGGCAQRRCLRLPRVT